MLRLSLFAVLILPLVFSRMSFAETNTITDNVNGFIAIGPAVAPDFEGSNDYSVVPLVAARAQSQEYYLELQGTRARANILPSSFSSFSDNLSIQAGPSVSFRPD